MCKSGRKIKMEFFEKDTRHRRRHKRGFKCIIGIVNVSREQASRNINTALSGPTSKQNANKSGSIFWTMAVGPRRRRAVNCNEKERANMAAVSRRAKLRRVPTRGTKWPIVYRKFKTGISAETKNRKIY